MRKSILALASATLMFAACNQSKQPETPATETTPPAATEEAAPAVAPPTEPAIVEISGGDDMKFDKTEITVKEGQTVKLTLKHTGKSPKDAMGHNFVLLASGTSLQDFATAAIKAKDNDYIPADMASSVIAHTKTIGGGETTEIEFTAPSKGTYDFLCSFPGHYGTMKGHFIVE
ncbi:MAG: azurin [Bacteroidota bacterium]|nr:MAG: azurin [Bacteroidota bacterium]